MTKNEIISLMKFKIAQVPQMFDNIRVVEGSEESIFNTTYVTGLLTNNRVVKFRKDTLVFKQ
jgi:hypothetical protein